MQPDYATLLRLASDPTTSAAALERIWTKMMVGSASMSQEGKQVLDAVARNPNLPVKLAPDCLGQHARALAENPALPFLMLECPDIARQSPVERLLRTLRRPDTPAAVVRLLAQHHRPIVAEAARLHISIAGELLESEVETELRKELAALPIGGKEKLQELHSWGLVPDWLVEQHRLKASVRPALPCNARAIRRVDSTQRLQKIPLEKLIIEYQEGFFGGDEFLMRTDIPEAFLQAIAAEKLAVDTSSRGLVIVLAIARSWRHEILTEHSRSRNWLNRLGVALNMQTPEKTLQRLQADANRIVRGVATYRASADLGFERPEPHRSA